MFRPVVVAVAALAAGVSLVAQATPPHIDSISADDLRADLAFLASDALEGRLTGTTGNRVAAEWVKARFSRLGLTPVGSSSFEHSFALAGAQLGSGSAMRVLGPDGETHTLKLRGDFYPQRFSASENVTADVVFAGFGIVSPERGHDDYGDAVKGRIALVLDREPGADDPDSPFDGLVASEAGQPLRKALAAQSRGAVGLVLVAGVGSPRDQRSDLSRQANRVWPAKPGRAPRVTLAAWAERVRIPVVSVSIQTAERLVRGSGKSLVELARSAERAGGVVPVPLPGVQLELTTSLERREMSSENIVSMLEGTAPMPSREYVLVGAHLDHDGTDGKQIWNGADDDGSGTVGMLEVAEAFALAARDGQRPGRSIVFAAWNAEEQGLLGSWTFVEQPPIALDRIAAVINLDMIGRNEEVPAGDDARFRGLEVQSARSNRNTVHVLGLSRSPAMRAAIDRANEGIGLEIESILDNHVSNLLRRSDNWPFLQRGVPAVFVTTGLHPDYHTPKDRPESIEYAKMERVVRLVYQLAWDLANQAERPSLAAPAPGGQPAR